MGQDWRVYKLEHTAVLISTDFIIVTWSPSPAAKSRELGDLDAGLWFPVSGSRWERQAC